MSEKVRLDFTFSRKAARELDSLKEKLDLTSRVDVVRQALALLQWAVNSENDGWKLLVKKEGKEFIVVLPTLKSKRT